MASKQKKESDMAEELRTGKKPVVPPPKDGDQTKVREEDLLDLVAGRKQITDPTINYLLERYKQSRSDFIQWDSRIREVEGQLEKAKEARLKAEGKTNAYAEDLRYLVNNLDQAPPKAEEPPKDPNKTYGPTLVKGKDNDRGNEKQADSGS